MRVAQKNVAPSHNPAFAFWLTDSLTRRGGLASVGQGRVGRVGHRGRRHVSRRPYVDPHAIGEVLAGFMALE